jgi:hypothetical protein
VFIAPTDEIEVFEVWLIFVRNNVGDGKLSGVDDIRHRCGGGGGDCEVLLCTTNVCVEEGAWCRSWRRCKLNSRAADCNLIPLETCNVQQAVLGGKVMTGVCVPVRLSLSPLGAECSSCRQLFNP